MGGGGKVPGPNQTGFLPCTLTHNIAQDDGGRGRGIESTRKHSNREPPHWDDMNYIHTRTTRDPKNANVFILGPNTLVENVGHKS